MPSNGDERATATILAALRKGPRDVIGLLGALRKAVPDLVRGREGVCHGFLHALLRRGVIRLDARRSPRGLLRYAEAEAGAVASDPAPVQPDAPPPEGSRARRARLAARVASGARDPAARGRIVADVLAHLAAIGDSEADAFGSARNARYYLRRADRGRPTVFFAKSAGDVLRRVVLHEGPWLVTAVVLFFVLRAFVLEVFFIPSGSMIPTLLPADRVVVLKPGGKRMPERWSIVTFERAGTTYVKRVAGLGGEKLAVAGGDVLIDGVVATKSQAVRDTLRFDYAYWSFEEGENPDWEEVGVPGEAGARHFTYRGPDLWSERYDAANTTADDVRLRDVYAELVALRGPGGRAALTLAFEPPESSHREVAWSVHVRDGAWGVRQRRGAEAGGGKRFPLESEEGMVRLRIAHVDGVIRAGVGGGVWEAPSGVPLGWVVKPRLGFEGGGRPLGLDLDKDLHYSPDGQLGIPSRLDDDDPLSYGHEIPAGHVFLLGDNTHDSNDSRVGSVGTVSQDELIGPVRFRIWPLGRLGPVR